MQSPRAIAGVALALLCVMVFHGLPVRGVPCPGGTMTPANHATYAACTSLTTQLYVSPDCTDEHMESLSQVTVRIATSLPTLRSSASADGAFLVRVCVTVCGGLCDGQ